MRGTSPRVASDVSSRTDGVVCGICVDRVCHPDARRAARSAVVRKQAVRWIHRRWHSDRLAAVSASTLTPPVRWALVWGPVVAYMAVIFYLSHQSSPPVPGGIPDWILHGVEYFGFAVVVF